ncbi:MAG TPA: ester cyclase [Chitinophagaceae bacterium]|jgi:steroid delta-isomerase-like uncharacterized protein|nr:ester cyclase [Chitinophagaceae bacterium]
MEERNRTLAKRIIDDVFSRGHVEDLESLVTSEIIIHDTDKELRGLEQVRQGIINLRTAFPDLQYTIEELLTDGDKVVARCKGTGTHNGVFRNIPATGKKMSYRVIFIWRFMNDKLAEHWSVSDVYGMLQQLGVIQLKVQGNANP